MNILFLILGVAAGVGELILSFRLFFADSEEYSEAWRYAWTPNLLSLFRGEYVEDIWAEFKLGIYHSAGILTGVAVYFGLDRLFS